MGIMETITKLRGRQRVGRRRQSILALWRWALTRGQLRGGPPADVPIAKEPQRIPPAWIVDDERV